MAINQTENPVTKYLKENPEKLILAEKIAVPVFMTGLLLHVMKIPGFDFLLQVGAVLSSLIYYLNTFLPVPQLSNETEGTKGNYGFVIFISKILFIALSVACAGILLKSANMQGNSILMSVALICLTPAFLISLFIINKSDRGFGSFVFFLRPAIAILILVFLLYL
jgi:hypothetical protein